MVAPTLAPPAGKAGGSARGVAANLVGAGFAGASGVMATWLVADSLGPVRAGAFFAATAAFVLAGGVAKLGTQTGLVYWPTRLRVRGHSHLLGACLRAALMPVAMTSVALGALLWFAAPTFVALTGSAGNTSVPEGSAPVREHAVVLRVLAVFLPLAVLSDCLLAATRGYRQLRPTVVFDRIARPAVQLAGMTCLWLTATWTVVTAPAYALVWVAPYLPVAILAGYALYRAHSSCAVAAPPLREEGNVRREFWAFTWPRAIASVAQQALQRVDVLLVAGLAGLGAAGVYAVAGRFVVLGQLANQAITQAVQPRLAERLASGDRAGATALYGTATGWLVLIAWPLCLVVICNAHVYLRLFGEEYRTGGRIVVVLAVATMVSTGCGMVDVVLSMAGRTLWNLGNVLVALVAMVAIDLALVPRLGPLGAAVGLATAVVLNNLLPLAQIGYALRLHPFGRGTWIAAALAVGCFGALPAAVAAFAGTGPVARLAGLAVAAAAYLAGAHLLRRPLALDAFAVTHRGSRHLLNRPGG